MACPPFTQLLHLDIRQGPVGMQCTILIEIICHLSTGAQLGQECGGIERPVDFQKLYNFKRYSSAGRLVRKGAILNPIPPTASNQSGLMCLYM